jgi:hypothetical protein
MQHQQQQPAPENTRVKVTSSIWGCAVGMLGICIPLTAIAESGPILPLAVIGGATLGTAAVWAGEIVGLVLNSRRFGGSTGTDDKQQVDALSGRIQELEERLTNVETIDRFEHHLAQRSMGGADGTPVAGLGHESSHRESTYQETTYQAAERV